MLPKVIPKQDKHHIKLHKGTEDDNLISKCETCGIFQLKNNRKYPKNERNHCTT